MFFAGFNKFALQKNPYELIPDAITSVTLDTSESVSLGIDKKPKSKWQFLIFQAHTQYERISASTSVGFTYGSTYNGSDVANLELLPISSLWVPFYLKSLEKSEKVSVNVVAVPYGPGSKN